MNPWITGRIIETMQQDSRARGDAARLGREAAAHRHQLRDEDHIPRRERVGLAVARLGLRIAGCANALGTGQAATGTPKHDDRRSNPWTTCGATSTSTR